MADPNSTEGQVPELPQEPIQKLVKPIARFLHVEAASGVVLLGATVAALIFANSGASEGFLAFWKTEVGFTFGDFEFRHSIKHLINDGLMAIFFFVIGLEVKREIVIGELRDIRRAALPIAAALGGIVVPAGLYLAVEWGQPGERGWGIPMATDIAFVVGCMALMGSRVPHTLRVTLLSLAIADDIGAILVIAVGYTENMSGPWLLVGLGFTILIILASRLGIRSFAVYVVLAIGLWFAIHESGVHATIAGVILGLLTPARSYIPAGLFGQVLDRAQHVINGDWESESHRAEKLRSFRHITRETIPPLEFLIAALHPWVSFVIMPLFALANAGVVIEPSQVGSRLSLAIILGLVVGKPVGIMAASYLSVKLRLASLPEGLDWKILFGGSCLCGIGFTMALFIAGLALGDDTLDTAKIGVLTASAISAFIGMTLLLKWLPPKAENDSAGEEIAEKR